MNRHVSNSNSLEVEWYKKTTFRDSWMMKKLITDEFVSLLSLYFLMKVTFWYQKAQITSIFLFYSMKRLIRCLDVTWNLLASFSGFVGNHGGSSRQDVISCACIETDVVLKTTQNRRQVFGNDFAKTSGSSPVNHFYRPLWIDSAFKHRRQREEASSAYLRLTKDYKTNPKWML